MRTHILIIAGVIYTAGFGFAKDGLWPDKSLTSPVCNAISNRWLTGEAGLQRQHAADITHMSPVVVNVVTNSGLTLLASGVKFFRVGFLRIEGQGRLQQYDHASVVVEGNGCISVIENDDEAVKFINQLDHRQGYSMSRSVKEVQAFAELRGYTLVTDEILEEITRRISRKESERVSVSKWTISIKNGSEKNLFEVTLAVHLAMGKGIIWCKRYFFEFSSDGHMHLIKIEDAGTIGGYM